MASPLSGQKVQEKGNDSDQQTAQGQLPQGKDMNVLPIFFLFLL